MSELLTNLRKEIAYLERVKGKRPITMALPPERYADLLEATGMPPEPYMLFDGVDIFPDENAPKHRRRMMPSESQP